MKKIFAAIFFLLTLAVPIKTAAAYEPGNTFQSVWDVTYSIFSLNWIPDEAGVDGYATVTRIFAFLFVFTVLVAIPSMLSKVPALGKQQGIIGLFNSGPSKVLAFLAAALSALYMPVDVLTAIGLQWGSIGVLLMFAAPIAGLFAWSIWKIDNKWMKIVFTLLLIAFLMWVMGLYEASPAFRDKTPQLMAVIPLLIIGLIIYLVYLLLHGSNLSSTSSRISGMSSGINRGGIGNKIRGTGRWRGLTGKILRFGSRRAATLSRMVRKINLKEMHLLRKVSAKSRRAEGDIERIRKKLGDTVSDLKRVQNDYNRGKNENRYKNDLARLRKDYKSMGSFVEDSADSIKKVFKWLRDVNTFQQEEARDMTQELRSMLVSVNAAGKSGSLSTHAALVRSINGIRKERMGVSREFAAVQKLLGSEAQAASEIRKLNELIIRGTSKMNAGDIGGAISAFSATGGIISSIAAIEKAVGERGRVLARYEKMQAKYDRLRDRFEKEMGVNAPRLAPYGTPPAHGPT